jgi:hypothetical protein
MERKALVLCSVVGLLGLLSVATGFGAEATRIKVKCFFFFHFNCSSCSLQVYFLIL